MLQQPLGKALGEPAHTLVPWYKPQFIGLSLVGKDIVFRFIIEYSSLREFGPQGNRSIFILGFLKNDILACVETWDLGIEL